MTIKPWENFKVEGEKIIFTIPEPKEKYDRRFIKDGIKFKTDEYRAWMIANEHFKRLNSISQGMRQKIFKRFKEGGISIKDTGKLFNVDPYLVSDIVVFNIEDISILREVSI